MLKDAKGPRTVTHFAVIPSAPEYPNSIIAQDDSGVLWLGDFSTYSIAWTRLPSLPTYDEVP